MTLEAIMWILAVIIIIGLLFLMVFNLLAFDELVNDHKNPTDSCSSINPFVLPEYGAQAVLSLMFLFGGYLVLGLLNAVVTAYHVHRYMKRPRMTHVGIYDPGSIYNQSQSFAQTNLQFWRIESTVKLVFYLVCFFYYLYSMMYTILA